MTDGPSGLERPPQLYKDNTSLLADLLRPSTSDKLSLPGIVMTACFVGGKGRGIGCGNVMWKVSKIMTDPIASYKVPYLKIHFINHFITTFNREKQANKAVTSKRLLFYLINN